MISKAKIKQIHALGQKKGRDELRAFVAEGPKVVGDLLDSGMKARLITAKADWHYDGDTLKNKCDDFYDVTDEELRKISFMQHPQQVLAVFNMPEEEKELPDAKEQLILALDSVQDPGNLGTIIRIADWFGIKNIICSQETADVYNPKTIQATMGSIARVSVRYTQLERYLAGQPEGIPVYGTLLDGKNIYTQELSANGIIVMGNEGRGISEPIKNIINRKLFIPNWPKGRETADSLNVAVATAITCSEFRRREEYGNI